jgi:hypothetical protein
LGNVIPVLGTQTKAANSTANQSTEITNSHESRTPLLISVSVRGPVTRRLDDDKFD